MTKQTLFKLMWTPGLFWVLWFWITHKDTTLEELAPARWDYWFAVYIALQVCVPVLALIVWLMSLVDA